MKLNALELLKKSGQTKYWLNKQLGMSYTNFNKMINNKTKSISYSNIEAMCVIFDCTPNELLILDDDN